MVATTLEFEGLFRNNQSLDRCVGRVMREYDTPLRERLRIRTRMALLSWEDRAELERQLTAKAMEMGALPKEGPNIVNGIYVGSWLDLFDWFINNWETILEIILAIIAVF